MKKILKLLRALPNHVLQFCLEFGVDPATGEEIDEEGEELYTVYLYEDPPEGGWESRDAAEEHPPGTHKPFDPGHDPERTARKLRSATNCETEKGLKRLLTGMLENRLKELEKLGKKHG